MSQNKVLKASNSKASFKFSNNPYINKKTKASITAYMLILPAFIFLCLFTIYPVFNSFYNSLYRNNMSVRQAEFIGFQNYVGLLSDDIFLQSFFNNLIIALVTVPASIALGVAMALFANKVLIGKWFYRTAFFYPTILPMVAVANIWLFIYTPNYGLLGFLDLETRILGSPDTALIGIMVMLIWKQSGYLMIFYMSGLQGISREYYEAAKIDGAGKVQTFIKITWPLLRPTTIYVGIVAITNAYKIVDHLYIMTKGGPNNSTNMLLYYIFQVGFDFWDTGKASAITIVLVALLLIVTSVQFYYQDKRAHYN